MTLAAARPRRPGPAHRGDRGRAAVGQRPRRRGRAVRRPAAGRRGAAGRPARAADRVADLDLRGPGAGADGGPLDRDADASCGCWRRPGARSSRATAGRRCRGLRGGRDERSAALVERAASRRRRPRRATSTAGLDEALEHGFVVEDADGVFLRHELVGRAVEADLLPSARIRHHAALAAAVADQPFMAMHHHQVALDAPAAGAAAIAAADAAAVVDSPGRRAGRARAGDLVPGHGRGPPAVAHGGPAATGSTPPIPTPTSRPRRRGGFAAGPAGRALRPTSSRPSATSDTRRDRARLGSDSTTGSASSGGSRATPRARSPRGAGPSSSSRPAPSPARAAVVAGLAQLRMLEGTFSEAEKLAREAIRRRPRVRPAGGAWELHATTTLGVSLGWRADPEAAVAMLTEARRDGRGAWATSTSCSGSTPT